MKTKEIKLALVAILSICIIYFGIIFLKGLKLFSTDNIYFVEMKDVGGLAKSAEVTSKGMKVGLVKDITYNSDNQMLSVEVELNEGIVPTQGSYANITKELLGAPKLNIVMGENPKALLNRGDTIKGVVGTDLMSVANEMIPQIKQLQPKLDSILTAINNIVNDPAIMESLNNLEYASRNLKTTSNKINSVLDSEMPQLVNKANKICNNLQNTTDKINKIDIVGIADNANQTLVTTNQTMQELKVFTNTLNNPNSSLGRLMNDPNIYNNLDSTTLNASRLLEDIRLNPKRYINFSLIGKKSK
ncbi:MAG: MCE family protein [Bacteroidaceae bacterium]|nr:MCE family protein [Bacteroidaceae bacterium]